MREMYLFSIVAFLAFRLTAKSTNFEKVLLLHGSPAIPLLIPEGPVALRLTSQMDCLFRANFNRLRLTGFKPDGYSIRKLYAS